MNEKSDLSIVPDPSDDSSKTLIVPPPGFHERLKAAQRARKLDIRSSVEIPAAPPQREGRSKAKKSDSRPSESESDPQNAAV